MGLRKDYDTNFEYFFWSIYPKRVGKPAAEKEFLRLHLTEAEMGELREHIIRRKDRDLKWRPNEKGKTFIVDPERFLKHRRFEDEYEEAPRQVHPAIAAHEQAVDDRPEWVKRGMSEEEYRARAEAARDKAMRELRMH